MRLTAEQVDRLIRQLKRWDGQRAGCPVCGGRSWGVNDTVFELREFSEGNPVAKPGLFSYPVVPITCNRCGYTSFINAVKAKILEPEEPTVTGAPLPGPPGQADEGKPRTAIGHR